MNYRLFVVPAIAAAISPLSLLVAVPLTFGISGLFYSRPVPFSEVLGLTPLVGAAMLTFAYPAMLVIGLPAYAILRMFGRVSLWSCALIGAVSGIFPMCVLVGSGSIRAPLSWAEWGRGLWNIWPFYTWGALVGVTFWVMVRPRKRAQNC